MHVSNTGLMPPHANGAAAGGSVESSATAVGDTIGKGASLFTLGAVIGGAAVGVSSLYAGAGNMAQGTFSRGQGIAILAGAALTGSVFLVAGLSADG